jgi:hypothetical protein
VERFVYPREGLPVLNDLISAAPVVSKDTVTLWIAVASASVGTLAILAQIVISLIAAFKANSVAAKPAPTPEPSHTERIMSLGTPDSQQIVSALEADKATADEGAKKEETKTALLDLLGKLSGTTPLAVVGILLIILGAVINGTLNGSIIFGNTGG